MCDLEKIEPVYAEKLAEFMQFVRDAATRNKCPLNDNWKRWKKLYEFDINMYRLLMHDELHVLPVGNQLIGLDCQVF